MDKKMQLIQLIATILASVILLGITSDIVTTEAKEKVKEWFISIKIIRIPTEEDTIELEDTYKDVSNYLAEKELLKDEILAIYSEVSASVVSNKAHKHLNRLIAAYDKYMIQLNEIKEKISLFERKYDKYIKMLKNIPDYSPALREKEEAKFEERIVPLYDEIIKQKQVYLDDEAVVENAFQSAKEIAEWLFNRDYYDLTIICYYEARGCSDLGIAYVANVITNRIESDEFWYAHNAHDVIYAPRQYEPTWTTSMNQTDARVQKVVEDFLRGRLDTEMPDNVLYQAGFKQPGKEIWKITEDGEYYCFG
ncbi:MAG: cell wall hydrolase [Clostridia bacterium]|nr:cell wall hydrolase [Clostridia bacterium]